MSLAVQNCGTVKLRGSPNLSTVAGGASRTVSRNGRRGDAAMAAARRVATRPRSTKLFTHFTWTLPSYAEDYCPKPLVCTQRARPAVQNRRNNPHPSEGFMVWRLTSSHPPLARYRLSSSTSASKLRPDELIKQEHLSSTYQDDYTGTQQGKVPPLKPRVPPSSVSEPVGAPYSLGSSMRHAYQTPRPSTSLKGNTTRYGCSEGFVKAACGIVPTLHKTPITSCHETWYSSEFGVKNEPQSVNLPRISSHAQLTVRERPANRRSKRGGGGGGVTKASKLGRAKVPLGKHSKQQDLGSPIWLSGWTGPM